MYKSITGLSGTLENFKDEQILKKAYKINLFRAPRNLPSKIPIYHRERPLDPFDLYTILLEEILEISNNNRPFLVIFNTIKQVEEFFIDTNYDRNKCGIIQGINANDYFEYSNIEILEILFGTEVHPYFFHNFRFLE